MMAAFCPHFSRRVGRFALVPLLIAATSLFLSAQTAQLRITAPPEATYLAGEVLLRAVVEPVSANCAVVDVTFFADSAKVCTVAASSFECQGDAGPRILSH